MVISRPRSEFTAEAVTDWDRLLSPETHFGYQRTDTFASLGAAVLNRRHGFSHLSRQQPSRSAATSSC